jgi:hypothetical protein
MAEVVYDLKDGEKLVVDLREPHWAALLAWLWPGAGHFYQRRFAKGFLYMTCVLSMFFLGIMWGSSRVVYASARPSDFRWQFICQAGVGLPALPAVIQAVISKEGNAPLWSIAHRYPPAIQNGAILNRDEAFRKVPRNEQPPENAIVDGLMAAPAIVLPEDSARLRIEPSQANYGTDVLGMWHIELGHFFEIGTLYTLVAGLLNMLAIYDAYVGPVITQSEHPVGTESV